MRTAEVDRPFDALEGLPRELWLGALITSVGTPALRLRDLPRWLAALTEGALPPADADLGDPQAVTPLRRVIGELGLPALAQGVPAAALQVARTALWHLDRLIDRPVWQTRAQAVEAMAEEFRQEWTVQRAGWEEINALLLGLGDLAMLRWDALQGRLNSREWAEARRLSALLAGAPEIVALIRRLGRGMPRAAPARALPQPADSPLPPVPVRWRTTRLPDAPGEVRGIRLGAQLSRMVPAEAAQLMHPVLHKLWRARLAESRLRVWDEEAVLVDAVRDPSGQARARAAPEPTARDRGPMIVCVDTSGSMKGAPEQLAKAVVLEAARTAHREGRGCRVIAFGGPDELIEWSLDLSARGLDALLAFMGQGFDGGTDIATPIERAMERVHEAGWQDADLLIVSDGEFGSTPAALARLDEARARHGLRVQGLLVGDRETLGLLEVCDEIHWVRDWRRYSPDGNTPAGFSPVHSQSLTALYFPNALGPRAARHRR
jgi:uncharacterized protein with von Willebrand factor type A (vWA) domain